MGHHAVVPATTGRGFWDHEAMRQDWSAPGLPSRAWHAELAWLPGVGVLPDVLIEAEGDRFTAIAPGISGESVPAGTIGLRGLTLPSLANAHSHAFHRALRGVSQRPPDASAGSFWTWRERMYAVAERLDPDSYLALARAVYAEMTLAGIGCVGEFHYVHHAPGGTPYADPNAMGKALVQAAAEAGLRITLLDTCYLCGGLDASGASMPLAGAQLRFGDGSAAAWAERMGLLGADGHGALSAGARLGAAIHSVRAVPPDEMQAVAAWSGRTGAPLHVHLSEQVAENEACLAAYRSTPAAVLYDAGVLGPRTTVVHATHLTSADMRLLGGTETFACVCPTTEADLADGLGPFGGLAASGCRLTVGSDSQAVIDLFEETRRIELYERLARGTRGVFGPEALGTAMTWDGHASLGWPDAGEIAPGSLADLVTVSLDSTRLAGIAEAAGGAGVSGGARAAGGTGAAGGAWAGRAGAPDLGILEAVIFAASSADVRNVVIGGRDVVVDGRHMLVDDVPGALASAIGALSE
ncbi:MAG TPA: formimidoylglutamate deiminase [Streptosporangiaceae bacterium]|nr:formimidoylglutamate deiminase [Streptosporangiaceae bacterium]